MKAKYIDTLIKLLLTYLQPYFFNLADGIAWSLLEEDLTLLDGLSLQYFCDTALKFNRSILYLMQLYTGSQCNCENWCDMTMFPGTSYKVCRTVLDSL